MRNTITLDAPALAAMRDGLFGLLIGDAERLTAALTAFESEKNVKPARDAARAICRAVQLLEVACWSDAGKPVQIDLSRHGQAAGAALAEAAHCDLEASVESDVARKQGADTMRLALGFHARDELRIAAEEHAAEMTFERPTVEELAQCAARCTIAARILRDLDQLACMPPFAPVIAVLAEHEKELQRGLAAATMEADQANYRDSLSIVGRLLGRLRAMEASS